MNRAAASLPKPLLPMSWALFLPLLPIAALLPLALHLSRAGYRTPEEVPYWALVFGLPHIVASFQTACDRDYLACYGRRVLAVGALVVLPYALYAAGLPKAWILNAFFLATVVHVISQQYGIAFAAARLRPSPTTHACKWGTVALGTMAYAQAYLASEFSASPAHAWLGVAAAWGRAPLLALVAATAALLVWRARARRAGALLLAANAALFLAGLVLVFDSPWPLAGLMLVRVLHDLTGFVVYLRHDGARNREVRRNPLYRVLPGLPVWLLGPAWALAIAAALGWLAQRVELAGWLILGLTAAHYGMERFIWKGGTPHRRHLSLSDA